MNDPVNGQEFVILKCQLRATLPSIKIIIRDLNKSHAD